MGKIGKVKRGTGKKALSYDMKKRIVSIDYSGYDSRFAEETACYRNDASVLFSLANSYWSATIAIEEKLQRGFEKENIDLVAKLIVPYLFEFRHFVELSIKALYMAVTGEQAKIEHDIKSLFPNMKEALLKLERDDRKGIFNITDEVFFDAKSNIEDYLNQMEEIVMPYFKNEPAVEYYRFLFDTNNNLNSPEIYLDFDYQKNLQKEYHIAYKKLISEIHKIHYIYDMR